MTTPSLSIKRHVSKKANSFTESVIREMTREALKHGAVNLSQGFPDFAAPEDIKRAAMDGVAADLNQYAITWGARDFREAIARKTKWYLGLAYLKTGQLKNAQSLLKQVGASKHAAEYKQKAIKLTNELERNYWIKD